MYTLTKIKQCETSTLSDTTKMAAMWSSTIHPFTQQWVDNLLFFAVLPQLLLFCMFLLILCVCARARFSCGIPWRKKLHLLYLPLYPWTLVECAAHSMVKNLLNEWILQRTDYQPELAYHFITQSFLTVKAYCTFSQGKQWTAVFRTISSSLTHLVKS